MYLDAVGAPSGPAMTVKYVYRTWLVAKMAYFLDLLDANQ